MYENVKIVCPFYKGEKDNYIYCESPCGDNHRIKFKTLKKKSTYKYNFCESFCYKGCPYALLNKE